MIEAVSPAVTHPSAPTVQAPRKAAQEFEAVFLRQWVEQILPQSEAVFGEGPGADVWRSFMAEAVASELARGGGFGLAAMVLPAPEQMRGDAR
jgi:Rod binding domain-containing protein